MFSWVSKGSIGKKKVSLKSVGSWASSTVTHTNFKIFTEKRLQFKARNKENCALLNSVQEFIEIEPWLLLTFFPCLHSQLNSIHSIVGY